MLPQIEPIRTIMIMGFVFLSLSVCFLVAYLLFSFLIMRELKKHDYETFAKIVASGSFRSNQILRNYDASEAPDFDKLRTMLFHSLRLFVSLFFVGGLLLFSGPIIAIHFRENRGHLTNWKIGDTLLIKGPQ